MKRYQINVDELAYIAEMLEFLSSKENTISDAGQAQLKEVLDRIQSRPVLETIIDPKVFEQAGDSNDDN